MHYRSIVRINTIFIRILLINSYNKFVLVTESTNPLKRQHDEIEDYDIWAKRVLEKARAELLKDSQTIKSS